MAPPTSSAIPSQSSSPPLHSSHFALDSPKVVSSPRPTPAASAGGPLVPLLALSGRAHSVNWLHMPPPTLSRLRLLFPSFPVSFQSRAHSPASSRMSSHSPPPTLPVLPLLFFSVMSSSPLFLLFFLLPAFGPGIAEAQLGPSQRSSSIFERVKEPTCRPVDVGLCRSVPYNRTIFPNPFVDLDLASLQAQTEHFKPLIRTQCSPHILFFVCSVFAPMCPEQMPQAVTSCRSVCEEVQRDCLQIFRDFDFPWPPVLNCSRFPSPPALCMRPEPSSAPVAQPPPPSPRLPECPQDLVDLEPTEPSGKCAPRCEKTTMFRKDRKEQARLWLLCWALLNALVALFTVCSFGIDLQRFCFPERSVCFLALCSLLSTLPHLWRPLVGFDSMACGQLPSGAKFLLLDELAQESRPCLVSFALAYYFSLAGSCWWLALGFTWYLSAARKWVEEELNKRSLLLHLLAWGLPALLAAAALTGHRVDASELTGICTLGNSDPLALLWLWLVPKLGLTLLGLFLLLAGFSAMCKERHSFRRRGTDTSRLEKFLLKMGTFTALYVLSALVASFCDLHHLTILAQWHPNTIGCKALGGAFSGQCVRPEQPAPEPYILGQTMALAAGIASGLWIFSPKTLISWRRALFCCWPSQPKLPVGRQGQMALQHHQTMALLTDPPAAPQAVSGYVRPPPSQRPPLSSLPSLPPPPPTAVPSSAYGSSSHFLPSQQQHQQRQNYIPLSILTSTQSAGRSANELVYQNPFQQAADL